MSLVVYVEGVNVGAGLVGTVIVCEIVADAASIVSIIGSCCYQRYL